LVHAPSIGRRSRLATIDQPRINSKNVSALGLSFRDLATANGEGLAAPALTAASDPLPRANGPAFPPARTPPRRGAPSLHLPRRFHHPPDRVPARGYRHDDYFRSFFSSIPLRFAKGECVANGVALEAAPPAPLAASSCRWCSLSWQYKQSSSQLLPSGGLFW
jgi:hypothetical protein